MLLSDKTEKQLFKKRIRKMAQFWRTCGAVLAHMWRSFGADVCLEYTESWLRAYLPQPETDIKQLQ